MGLSELPPDGVRLSGAWVFVRSSKFETLRDFRFCSIFGVACLCVHFSFFRRGRSGEISSPITFNQGQTCG